MNEDDEMDLKESFEADIFVFHKKMKSRIYKSSNTFLNK